MRKFGLLVLICLILNSVTYADQYDNGGYVGTPPGFYDDIDPNSLEEDDEVSPNKTLSPNVNNPSSDYSWENTDNKNGTDIRQNSAEDNNQNIHELNDDEDVGFILAPKQSSSTKNYALIYNNLEPADFSYLHNIDPDQYYDMKDTTWSVYPLLRLNSEIYFKGQTIEPGYYLLTPREHNGKWYLLFKQNGIVAHIIPVYDRDYTPESFYDEHIPKPKLTPSQKVHTGFLSFVGKTVKSSKRKDPIKSYLEVNDLENHFVSIVIYYGGHKYSTIFRTVKL